MKLAQSEVERGRKEVEGVEILQIRHSEGIKGEWGEGDREMDNCHPRGTAAMRED